MSERQCDTCGVDNTDPLHFYLDDDGLLHKRHPQCCVQAGCPTNVCQEA